MTDFFFEYKTVFQLVHLLGVVIALSGAVLSDTAFFDYSSDSKITGEEISRLRKQSWMVILGLVIIILSGICIFLSDVPRYTHSPKFLAKMTIVAILLINGFILHNRHLPYLVRTVGVDFNTLKSFPRRRVELVVTGAVSNASWVSALALGTIPSLPFDYFTIMSVYISFLCVTILGTLLLRKRLI